VLQANYTEPIVFDHRSVYSKEAVMLFPRDATGEEIEAAMRMLASGVAQPDGLITHEAIPDDAPEIYRVLIHEKDRYLTALIRMHEK
jgi:threonine dehydrogenase-like Zn-dependent dehydrogenase